MSTDERLIRRLQPVLSAAAPEPGEPVHAEVLHQLCAADGLLEVLDWSRQGTAADPLACLWLGSLRWHRLLTGKFPAGAPEPPPRGADATLRPAFAPGGAARRTLAEGSGSSSLSGLASGEMGHPGTPAQPEQHDAAALLRVVPIGLVPYVEQEMRLSWAEQAVCLTHGAPSLRRQARRLAALFNQAAGSTEPLGDPIAELEGILRDSPGGTDELAAEVLRRQLAAAAQHPTDEDSTDEGRTVERPIDEVPAGEGPTGEGPADRSPAAPGSAGLPMTAAETAETAEAAGSALRAAAARLVREWEEVTRPAL